MNRGGRQSLSGLPPTPTPTGYPSNHPQQPDKQPDRSNQHMATHTLWHKVDHHVEPTRCECRLGEDHYECGCPAIARVAGVGPA